MGKNRTKKTQNSNILRKKEVYIPIIVTTVIAIIIASIFYALTINNQPCIPSTSGNTYRDCSMNFEISKPNRDWEFHYDFNVNAPKFDYHFPGQSIVEMVLVQRTNNEQVAVMVFNDRVDLDFEEFLDKEFEMASKAGTLVEITYEDPEEIDTETTIKTQIYPSKDNKEYSKLFQERIIKKDNLVYVVHSQILSTHNVSEKIKSEVNQIFNSFDFVD